MDLKEMMERHFWRSANLFERIVLGPLTPELHAPREVVYQWGKIKLYHYEPVGKVRAVPVLIVPPLGVKPTIFDLRSGHSMVEHLSGIGLDLYMLEYGVPDKDDLERSVIDYATRTLPQAVSRVRDLSGSDRVSLVGWSLGGIFSYLYSAWGYKGGCVGNLVALGSPVDFSRMYPFNILAKLGGSILDGALDIMGNLPAPLLNLGFKTLSPFGSVRRQMSLVRNYWDREYVAGYETIADWAGGFLPYPAESLRQFAKDFMAEDKLKQGALVVDGEHILLSNIKCPVLAFVGTTDKVAAPGSVSAIEKLTSSEDVTALRVPLGHIGLVSGSKAPELVWEPMGAWLLERS